MLTVDEIQYVGESIALYKPVSADLRTFHNSLANIRWLFGGNQSSKSYSSMMDLAMLALDIHPTRSPIPGGVHWACIESWEQVRDILWASYLEEFIPAHQIADVLWGQDKVPKKVYLKTGHVIEFKAFNQGRRLFEGRKIDSCHCDEQCPLDFTSILSEIQARLLAKEGSLVWSMTPIVPQPALEERIENLPMGDEVFHSNLNDNRKSKGGYIPDERVDAMIQEWPEEIQLTRIEGKFASFIGAVFKTFSRSVHVIDPFSIPVEWNKYRGFDFGFTNPFVCLWTAQDNDGNWHVYREYYKAKTGIQEHIRTVKHLSGAERYVSSFADPENAEDRAEMQKAGIANVIAQKDVARGVETLQGKLKVKSNGKPSLFIHRSCRQTCREIPVYHYPRGTASANPKDVPVQKDDHTIDALRYIIYSVEKPRKRGRAYAA